VARIIDGLCVDRLSSLMRERYKERFINC